MYPLVLPYSTTVDTLLRLTLLLPTSQAPLLYLCRALLLYTSTTLHYSTLLEYHYH